MPRIQIPQIDKPASRFDKVIGSDVDNASVTRNYQLGDILALFNSLSGGGIFSYRFTTALIDLDSISGKMATVNGVTDPDSVTSFRFSTSDLDKLDITTLVQNYETNSDNVVLKITSETDPNLIAVYIITSVTATTNYVDVEVLQHKNFNTLTFVNHQLFILSFDYVNVTDDVIGGATNTSQLTNDGDDGINPFVTLDQLPIPIDAYITDSIVIGLLRDRNNWSVDGVYLGTVITGTFQGQKHFDTAYLFEAVEDNTWIKYPRA